MHFIPSVATIVFSIVITFLVTFFFTSISTKKALEKLIKKESIQHSLIYHKDIKPVKEYILEHEKTCIIGKDVANIKVGIAFIVGKFDGDPHKMGLL